MTANTPQTCCSRFQKFLTIIFYLAGIALSGYAYFVEYQLEKEPGKLIYNNKLPILIKPNIPIHLSHAWFIRPNLIIGYKAMCDIDESHSCTTVFNSTYGRGFGIVGKLMGDENHPVNVPNSLYGIIFYRYLNWDSIL